MTSMPEVAGRNDDRYFGAVTGAPELVVRPLSGWNAQGVYSELSESSRRVDYVGVSLGQSPRPPATDGGLCELLGDDSNHLTGIGSDCPESSL
ncbi:hypothetical protein PCASD_24454 [Puccinia coronata f. sp. avenae]|uniref:Uncharacterized protein n=1 Tax=Puccinia coronata f. sp. avenae TaxID=200324 RepID=A0A2N5S1B9_9BASI|nr:hypothetical protein PCASD_24454 [Puccinia coronata f. sp. avenae]